MAKIEIEESELQNYRRIASVAERLGKHPEARALLQKGVALVAPDEVGPEVLLRNEFTEGLNAIRGEMKADREAREAKEKEQTDARDTRAFERKWIAGRAKAREAHYTDEAVEGLEQFMEKHGIADHELAMPAFEKKNPPPEPVVSGGTDWNFFDQRDNPESGLEMLLKGDQEGFLRKAVPAALAEVRGRAK
jgi:hypothetical protein